MKKTVVRYPEKSLEALKFFAADRGFTDWSELARRAIDEYLEKHGVYAKMESKKEEVNELPNLQ